MQVCKQLLCGAAERALECHKFVNVKALKSASSGPANHATPDATKRFLEKLRAKPGAEARVLGRTGLYVSPVGFGCHRLNASDEETDALKGAIKCGVNLIDVAPNYTDGTAEKVVGDVLKGFFASGEVKREELIISTKVGNIVGTTLEQVKARATLPDDVSKVRDDVWHCISPEWIEEELTGSLERLGLESIDILLLHCPEFAANAPNVTMEDVYAKIARACQHLESEVARGRIQRYGITAAFYPLRPSDPGHLVLSRILTSLPESHHFQVLQFPLNFAEPTALWSGQCARDPDGVAIEQGAGLGPSLLELAQQHGLATLVNRPLDGVYREVAGTVRFASDVPFNSAMQGEDIDQMEEKLTQLCPGLTYGEDRVTEQLAGKTIRVLAALEGIDCVLVGMRQPTYVVSVMQMLAHGQVDAPTALRAVRSLNNSLGMWFCTASSASKDHGTAKDWRLPVAQKYGGEPTTNLYNIPTLTGN